MRAFAGLVLACWSVSAHAHLVSTRFGELYNGMLHPLLALEHVVPWLALGLVGALAGSMTSRWAVAVFPLGVFVGVLVAAFVPGVEAVGVANLLSFVLLGGLVVANIALPKTAFLIIVALIGLSHGYGNGSDELVGNALLLYATGVALAAYLIVTLVTAGAVALARQEAWGRIAIRAAGSWVLAIGLVFGGFSMLAAS